VIVALWQVYGVRLCTRDSRVLREHYVLLELYTPDPDADSFRDSTIAYTSRDNIQEPVEQASEILLACLERPSPNAK